MSDDVSSPRASLEALQADRPDLMAITNIEDLRYLVRRFEHETCVRVGAHETIEDCTRALAGALMSIKAMQANATRALSIGPAAMVLRGDDAERGACPRLMKAFRDLAAED